MLGFKLPLYQPSPPVARFVRDNARLAVASGGNTLALCLRGIPFDSLRNTLTGKMSPAETT